MAYRPSTTKGFKRTSALLETRIRRAGETRGFAVTRLITHWAEVVGDDIAKIAYPVDVKYGRQGFGATLTVLTTGANAPMLDMQKETIRTRVNAVYGYNAIARIHLTQTAPTGFSEGRVQFKHKDQKPKTPPTDPAIQQEAQRVSSDVQDDGLKSALETLARNVLSKSKRDRGTI